MDQEVRKSVEKFFSAYPKQKLGKGEFLIFGGEEPNGIFYLTIGTVRQYAISAGGEEAVVNIFKPPAFFPMNWAINKTKNKYFYESMETVEFRKAPAEKTLEFIKKNPAVTLDLLSRLYSGVEGLLERTVYLMGGSATNRIAVELIIACKRFGERRDDGSYNLKINQQELASRVGLSRETISRDLKNLPYIKVAHGGVIVTDLSALERSLG